MVPSTFQPKSKKVEDSDLTHFFQDGTKGKYLLRLSHLYRASLDVKMFRMGPKQNTLWVYSKFTKDLDLKNGFKRSALFLNTIWMIDWFLRIQSRTLAELQQIKLTAKKSNYFKDISYKFLVRRCYIQHIAWKLENKISWK